MEQKENTSIESSNMTPEMRTFFDLVDREAQRVHLLSKNNRMVSAEKPLTPNQVIWQPSFEMVDFALPSDGSSKVINSTNNGGEERTGEVEEKGPKRTLKRPRDSVDLASLPPNKEKTRKTSSSDAVLSCETKKEADPSVYGAKNWSLWYKS